MVDLSFLESESTLGKLDAYVASISEPPRKYLGMSEIGDCARKLWLKYHQGVIDVPTPRMKRLFDMGKIIEKRIIKEMKGAGFKVAGRQKMFSDFDGKFLGHCDGIIKGIPESTKKHILEIKSASAKNFKLFQSKGLKEQSLEYWEQMQCYMGYAKIDRGLFIVENKDDSSRYQERIKFDREAFNGIKAKAKIILESKTPPSGVDDWTCNWCHCNTTNLCRKNWNEAVPF